MGVPAPPTKKKNFFFFQNERTVILCTAGNWHLTVILLLRTRTTWRDVVAIHLVSGDLLYHKFTSMGVFAIHHQISYDSCQHTSIWLDQSFSTLSINHSIIITRFVSDEQIRITYPSIHRVRRSPRNRGLYILKR